jgi:formamidopyrimidine-DNA glycosylase
MPELPEVETMRRGVALAEGAPITAIVRPRSALQSICIEPPLPKFRRRAVGRRIAHVGRLGKRVILELDSGDRIVMEPRMTGLVLLADPPDRKHLRLVIELSGPGVTQSTGCPGAPAEQILFWDQRGLGVVRLVSPAEFDRLYGPAKIGPDALEISVEELRRRIGHSPRAIKVALLDQKAVAGVGNLYASEILHRAGVHPAQICRRLRKAQWQSVHAEMLRVLNDAIQHQGSTLRDGTYRIARDAPGNYQYNHRVYQRHGQACLACGKAQIMRIVQAQRSTFYCPACQRK